MAKYTSAPVTVAKDAGTIADKFADLSVFESSLDELPESEREKIGDVSFSPDSITIKTPQVGDITMKVVERSTSKIVMQAVGSPVPLSLSVVLNPVGVDSTEITAVIEVEIPAMLRPLIGGAMQKAADQFGALMGKLNS